SLDDTYHIISSLLSDKIYQIYIDHNEPVAKLLDRASILINNQANVFVGWDANVKQVWDGLLESIPAQVKSLIGICRDTPGLNELAQKDLTNLVNNRLFDYFLLKHSPLFINGESYLMLPNMIQYTRTWMLRIIGQEMVETIFRFAEEFNSLKMTNKEIALMYPFVLTMPDDNYDDPCTIANLNEYYYRTLMYEFDLNRRNSFFVTKWKSLVAKLPQINEIQMKHIGGLKPETDTVDNSQLVENGSFNSLIDNLRNLDC
ncbi:nuclear receptor subfamily 1 group D member 1-like, partial [Brachionus plicatilis]